MAFIDGEEKPLASLSTEALIDRFRHTASSKEESIIIKILESRGVVPQINNPFEVYNKLGNIHTEPIKGIYELFRSAYATPLLDPTRYVLFGVDLAKDDSDLKINVKRRNIKFNFNN